MSIIVGAFEDLADRHGLSLAEQAVFTRLLLLVDYRTGEWRGTQAEIADRLGLQRHRLRPKLDRLAEAGLIEQWFPRGHDGAVRVPGYLEVVHLSTAQVTNHPLRGASDAAPLGPKRSLRKDRLLPSATTPAEGPQGPKRSTTGTETVHATSTPLSVSVDALATGEETAPADDALPAVPARAAELCDALADSIAARGSKRPNVTKGWLDEMGRLIRLDGRDPDDVARVIRWLAAAGDDIAAFWQPNVRSPKTLRLKWDQMREQHQSRARRRPSRQQQTDQAWADTQALQQAVADGHISENFNPLDALTGSAS